MPINCFYIDDEASTVEPLWKLVVNHSEPGTLEFICQKPQEFGKQIDRIKAEKPDILILDLRLDENPTEAGQPVPYRGFTLAQELRTRMTEGEIPSKPIVLWSLDSKLKTSYESDDSAHNLFDQIYDKEKQVVKEPKRVALELQSLVKGYQQIQRENGLFHKMLGLEKQDDVQLLHPNIGEPFVVNKKCYPVHEYARYILRELIEAQGPLINESVLAARLGIDIQNSPDWARYQSEFLSDTCAYTGAFNEAWPRWWAFQLEEWWHSLPDSPTSLRRLKAKERVAFLRQTTGLKHLEAPTEPIDNGYSERYWTICQGFEKPLDPLDAFRVSSPNQKFWQEPLYLSIKATLERMGQHRGLKIDPLEYERFQDVRERMEA